MPTPKPAAALARLPAPRSRPALRRALLAWYDAHRRDLPWRHTADPYQIWLSEAMLQQTRVETVIPYYQRFLAEFPTVERLAAAPLERVLSLWAGLGYYSRARNLHRAAQAITAAGRFPDTVEELRALPGVGPYIAGAVASIAFQQPAPTLDGNIQRVYARFTRLERSPAEPAARRFLWQAAAQMLDPQRPGDFNQALMELGATVCRPRRPACGDCPWRSACAALAAGATDRIPIQTPRATPRSVAAAAIRLERRGRVLWVQRPADGLLGGLWELPGGEFARGAAPGAAAAAEILERDFGLVADSWRARGAVRHQFTHRTLTVFVFEVAGLRGRLRTQPPRPARWLRPDEWDALPLARVDRKVLELLERPAAAATRPARSRPAAS